MLDGTMWYARHEVPNWERCQDGTAFTGKQTFSFYPVDPDGSGEFKTRVAGNGRQEQDDRPERRLRAEPMAHHRSADAARQDRLTGSRSISRRLCRKQVLPLLGRRRGCQIRLLVQLPVRSEITTGTRVVRGDRDRRDGLNCLAAERTWGRLRPASVDHGRWPRGRRRPVQGRRRRNVEWRYRRKIPRLSRHVGRRRRRRRCGGAQRARWWSCSPRPRGCSARDGPQWQRCSLDRAEDSLVGGDPVVGWYALGKQVRIQRGRAEHMLAHRQRHVRLVAVADLDGGRALSGMTHAGIVAGAANRKR